MKWEKPWWYYFGRCLFHTPPLPPRASFPPPDQPFALPLFPEKVIKWSQLSEINAGLMDSLTYEHVAAEMPQEYEARQKDKLCYRSVVKWLRRICRGEAGGGFPSML